MFCQLCVVSLVHELFLLEIFEDQLLHAAVRNEFLHDADSLGDEYIELFLEEPDGLGRRPRVQLLPVPDLGVQLVFQILDGLLNFLLGDGGIPEDRKQPLLDLVPIAPRLLNELVEPFADCLHFVLLELRVELHLEVHVRDLVEVLSADAVSGNLPRNSSVRSGHLPQNPHDHQHHAVGQLLEYEPYLRKNQNREGGARLDHENVQQLQQVKHQDVPDQVERQPEQLEVGAVPVEKGSRSIRVVDQHVERVADNLADGDPRPAGQREGNGSQKVHQGQDRIQDAHDQKQHNEIPEEVHLDQVEEPRKVLAEKPRVGLRLEPRTGFLSSVVRVTDNHYPGGHLIVIGYFARF